ncbi:hypothetical protein ACHAPE_008644 [Trichoderma viride]
MDEESKGARVPFDMRLHVPPMAQTSYNADHYHAMKRLVTEGYITIKPNAKIKFDPRGLWEADGQSPLAEAISREESPVEPYISAETVETRTSPGSDLSPGSQDSDLDWEEEDHILGLMRSMNGILATKHDNAHPAWARLQKSLKEYPGCFNWTVEALKAAIFQADREELEDWTAFNVSYAYCKATIGSPEFRQVASVNNLMRAFCHFCGCPASQPFFPGDICAEDEGDEETEGRRVKALNYVVQTKDPSNANAIMQYVKLIQISRDFGQARPRMFTAMEELYQHLEAVLEKRKLGVRMLGLLHH